jgi:hypothetical protein
LELHADSIHMEGVLLILVVLPRDG